MAFGVLLAAAYGTSLGGRLDATALNGLIALRGPVATPLAWKATHGGDPIPVAAMVAGLFAFGWACGRRRQAVAAAIMVPLAVVSAEVLKILLAHPRVHQLIGESHIGAAAFPSGHATAAMAVALAAVLVVPRRMRFVVAPLAALYAIAVSTSILVLAWHYPSDVFGGMLLASFYFCAAVTVLRGLPAAAPARRAESSVLGDAPRGWREALAAAAVFAVVVLLARADDVTAFASAHTLAAATALAVAACSAALVAAASALEP